MARVWHSHSREISALALVTLALLSLGPRLLGRMPWEMDGLFYQAQVRELQGESQSRALQDVFTSQAATMVPGATTPALLHNHSISEWVKYSSHNYRRRWVVPALAAAIYPIAGIRSLLYVSILGYIAVGLLLFALLRRRFGDGVSVTAAAGCLLLSPLRSWSGLPMTDSWGLAVQIGALLAALVTLERGGRWCAVWFLSMLLLSFTRDATVVLIVAIGVITIMTRTRRSAAVLGLGIAASIPAPLLFGAPFLQELAYNLHGYRIPRVVHLSHIISAYPAGLWALFRHDITSLANFGGHPLVGYTGAAVLLASVGYMTASAPRSDAFFTLQRGALLGAAVTIALAASWSNWRLELVFVPAMAVGVAFTLQRVFIDRSPAAVFRFVSARAPLTFAGRRA